MRFPSLFLAVFGLVLCLIFTGGAQAHWSFPGSIENHLQFDHGVDATGLSYREKLNLHDSLHEGYSSFATSSVVHIPGRPIQRTINAVQTVAPVKRTINVLRTVAPVRRTLGLFRR